MATHRQVTIIGTGPAGLTAALYAGRANLSPLVIEGIEAGGQLMLTTAVENYPGFRDGIMGPDLMQEMRLQAERFGATFVPGDATSLDLSQRPLRISLGKTEYTSDTVILATGASAKWLDLGVDKQLSGRGVSTCATCDGFFFKGRDVAIVGGGDTAMEEAIYLSKLCSSVTVIHRRDTLRASKVMQDKARSLPNIKWIWSTEVIDIKDITRGEVTGLVLRNLVTQELSELAVAGIFIAIGHIPNTKLVAGQVTLDDNGYIVPHGGTRTNVPGVFAAGDVQDHIYRQAVTAAGTGCMAAIDAERFLSGLSHENPVESISA
ncbi:MAG TPA: thioredoxin-disulfide reductase [Vicinamibacterales bacterium]|nr:thioredoxin-disulfide reductase [Vicinamibacterales bacterium]